MGDLVTLGMEAAYNPVNFLPQSLSATVLPTLPELQKAKEETGSKNCLM